MEINTSSTYCTAGSFPRRKETRSTKLSMLSFLPDDDIIKVSSAVVSDTVVLSRSLNSFCLHLSAWASSGCGFNLFGGTPM